MTKYVALLRGINVGGHTVKMTELTRVFESLGLSNVKTYIASGNVLFETAEGGTDNLAQRIENELSRALGFEARAILRTISELRALIDLDPFSSFAPERDARYHVTFFAGELNNSLELPYKSPAGFEISHRTKREVFSVVLPAGRSVDMMSFVEKEFGKASTTRNWNTVQKIAAL